SEILPILLGETDVVATKNKLIEIANSQNGHDNVTVALIYYQVDPKHDSGIPTTISLSPMTVGSGSVTAGDRSPTQSPQKTVRHQRPSSDKNKALYFLAALLLPALVGSLFYIFQPLLGEIFGGEGNSNMEPSTPPVSAENNSASNFIKGEFIGIFSRATDASGQINPLILFKKNRATKKGRVPSGSIMQVMEMASDSDWLLLKICYIPKTNQSENSKPKMPQDYQTLVLESPNSTQIVPSLKWLLEGETGWIKKSAIELVRHNSESLSSEQQGECF
ncbi:MAG: hypothetical protein F6K35_51010, partial [Okeania sp. SIO2H7]|nr:hypothetical protein [Okeania sp. SIO2H7]